jgi:P-type conjugative transfer ATPase TrbB
MDLDNDLDERDLVSLKRALGRPILEALADPLTIELALNPDGRLWQERLGDRMRCIGTLDAHTAMNVVRRIAGAVGAEITRAQPLLECELPLGNERVAAQIPPVTTGPTLTIRKPASSVFSIEQYVASQGMTRRQADVLLQAIADHRNIFVIGGTSSGKTTLVNALIGAIVDNDPGERVVIIEDTRELQCTAENSIRLKTDKKAKVDMRELLRTTLRMRPDRILVGEVRGPEALSLLMAWTSGHRGGCATAHADHSRGGLSKLSMLVSMDPDAPRPIEPLIAEAVNLLVHIRKTPQGRRVAEILEVAGYENNQYITQRIDS